MPRLLPHRCGADTILGFRAAAARRYEDGCMLADSTSRERRTAAVYLWGYAVEMVLKAAMLEVRGHVPTTPVTIQLLGGLKQQAAGLGIVWQGNLHAVASWGELLVAVRANTPGLAPFPADRAGDVIRRSAAVQLRWQESVRYHANVAYLHEVAAVREHTGWFVTQAAALAR